MQLTRDIRADTNYQRLTSRSQRILFNIRLPSHRYVLSANGVEGMDYNLI
jgi:hypothetical protein